MSRIHPEHSKYIRILLVVDIPLTGNVIAAVLEDEPDMQVVGVVTSQEAAMEFLHEHHVDLALVSTRLPDQGALHLTNEMTEMAPETKVLALGLTDDKERVLRYVEAGAVGYILQDNSLDELLYRVRATMEEKAIISPEVAAALMERLSDLAQKFSDIENSVVDEAGLTPREQEVLELIGRGMTNQEIAEKLVIEVGTVKNHVHNILDKLNVSSRGEAAAYLAFINK